jgi:hypothetical protein
MLTPVFAAMSCRRGRRRGLESADESVAWLMIEW